MHTSSQLRSDHFGFVVADRPGRLETIFPDFTEHDRLGVVIASDYGGAGASTVILAAVTAFYDYRRAAGDDFVAYPDFFAFHLGRPRGSLRKLDIYPAHKEIVVDDDPQAALEAINDRGITRLLVEQDGPGDPAPTQEPRELSPWSRDSALRRIRSVLSYSRTGRAADADVVVSGSAQTEVYVAAMLGGGDGDAAAETAALMRTALVRDGRPVESFRRISPDQALHSLTRPRAADSGT